MALAVPLGSEQPYLVHIHSYQAIVAQAMPEAPALHVNDGLFRLGPAFFLPHRTFPWPCKPVVLSHVPRPTARMALLRHAGLNLSQRHCRGRVLRLAQEFV